MSSHLVGSSEPLLKNSKYLEELINEIPIQSGCYLFKDIKDNFLYIGKSKNLRNRVRSYFRSNSDQSPRIKLMVRQVYDLEFIVTDTEVEALTLESNLIKEHQPYFNVLLKDDKKYPYLCITWSEPYPRVFITRRRRERNQIDRFYGPFVDVALLRKTLFIVKRAFPMRQRPHPLYKDKTCLNYSIGRCPGVCQGKISPSEYQRTLKKISMVFQGRNDELKNILEAQMEKYSSRMEYEQAGLIRDQINGIESLTESQKMTLPDSTINMDVIAMSFDKKVSAVQIFQMRSGKLVGRLGFNADSKHLEKDVVMQKVIEEHYSQIDSVEIPPEIILQFKLPMQDIIKQWLSELRTRNVNLIVPKRGLKADLIKLVEKNSTIELTRIQKGVEKQMLAMEDLAQLLELAYPPRRIEGYDISHIHGSDAVGSQVVFIDGVPAKHHYRKYKIKASEIKSGHSDDYMALGEVVRRRFRKWSELKNSGSDFQSIISRQRKILNTEGFSDWPDLIMIDGGKGQLSTVVNVLTELNLHEDISVCSLAKKNEEIFIPGFPNSLNSDSEQIGLTLLRRLRDEAHRFAVSFHRQQRSKRMTRSRLGDIPGVGSKKLKDLLSYFKSVDAIQMATVEQLSAVPGFGHKSAFTVWTYFHSKDQTEI